MMSFLLEVVWDLQCDAKNGVCAWVSRAFCLSFATACIWRQLRRYYDTQKMAVEREYCVFLSLNSKLSAAIDGLCL
jgi:hypothetical protein